jgi:NADH-quinone oxidoreductase subunit N
MNQIELIALSPVLFVTASAVGLMLLAAFKVKPIVLNGFTLLGLVATLAAMLWADNLAPVQVTPLLIVDRFALFYSALIVLAGMVVTLLSGRYLHSLGLHVVQPGRQAHLSAEYYVLLLTAVLGAMVLVCSRHFAALFLGLELLGVSLYVLVAYLAPLSEQRAASLEAGMKYLILSGVASAILLFGVALLYAEFGTLEYSRLGEIWSVSGSHNSKIVVAGLALLLSGICFKLSLVPFHMWTPDVYEGAPVTVTALVATVSKGAVFALLLRLVFETGAFSSSAIMSVMAVIAIASMLIGNLLALLQRNVKRILAYSSIAHIGYLLVVLLAGANRQTAIDLINEAAGFYLVAYFVMTLGAFGVISVLSRAGNACDQDQLAEYRGLFWRAPGMALILTAMLLSLAGIPLTVGFIGKFYVVVVGVQAMMWLLLGALVLGSAIGLFYYLRFVVVMFLPAERESAKTEPRFVAPGDRLVLSALLVLLLWLGVFPDPLVRFIQSTTLGWF